MVTKRWTVEQQMIDREQWARLEERTIAEVEKRELLESVKIEAIKRLLDLGLSHEDVARGAGVELSLVEEVAAGMECKLT